MPDARDWDRLAPIHYHPTVSTRIQYPVWDDVNTADDPPDLFSVAVLVSGKFPLNIH